MVEGLVDVNRGGGGDHGGRWNGGGEGGEGGGDRGKVEGKSARAEVTALYRRAP